MASRLRHRLIARRLVCWATIALCSACGDRAWQDAERLWRTHDPLAYSAWEKLDRSSVAGRDAHARLATADAHYQRAIVLLQQGDAGTRAAFETAVGIAPMAPSRYLELARACKAQGLLPRAASLYRKYLAVPDAVDRDGASAELAAIERDALAGLFDDAVQPAAAEVGRDVHPALIVGAVLAGLLVLLWVARRRRGESLREIADASPELQPAIAFLIGTLRHELLKHRLLVLGDAIAALERGAAEPGHHTFVVARLFGGTPLVLAWAGHLGAFIRALGPRFDLSRSDPEFARAKRALDRISRLAAAIHDARPAALAELATHYRSVARFDAYLAGIQQSLVRQRIDATLLDEVRADITAELAGRPCELAITLPEAPLEAELFRVDLVLLLRNLIRNAYQAALAAPANATPRVGVVIEATVEPTGEEAIWINVFDSHPGAVPLASNRAGAFRGLDLVDRILARCDGTIEQIAGRDGYQKGLRVRLFGSTVARSETSAAAVGAT